MKYICNKKKVMKKIKSYSVVLLFIIALGTFFSSCTSTTMITSQPPGAKVFLNNSYVGKTPYSMTDNKLATSCTSISLRKNGYKPLQAMICKDEKINVGAAVGGFFVWPIWLWIYDYYPEHKYILQPLDSQYSYQNSNSNQQMKYTIDDQQASQQQTAQTQEPQQVSKAQKLQDLKKLYDDGVLSKKEYEKEKQKILEQEEW